MYCEKNVGFIVVLMVFLMASCATTDPKKDLKKYPTPEHFEDLLSEKVEPVKPKVKLPEKAVTNWTMRTARPNNPATPAILGDKFLADVVSSKGVLVTAGAQCLAQEVLAFWLENRAAPSFDLRQFMSAWCGVAYDWQYGIYIGEADRKLPKIGNGERGVARFVEGKEASSVVIKAARTGEFTFVQNAEELVVRGRVRPNDKSVPVGGVSGVSTQGTYGYEYCQKNEDVDAPDFELTCLMNKDEPMTRISVLFSYEGVRSAQAILSRSFFSDGVPTPTYRSPALRQAVYAAIPESFRDGPMRYEDFRTGVVDSVNAVRSSFGVKKAVLSVAQSNVVARALVPLRANYASNRFDKYNLILAGLEAGWKIPNNLMDSGYTWISHGEKDRIGFVEHLFLSAFGRATVLNPNTSHFAFGSQKFGEGWMFSMLFSYSKVPDDHLNRFATRVIKRINTIRAKNGLPKAKMIKETIGASRELSARLRDGDVDLEQAWKKLSDHNTSEGYWGNWYRWGTISDIEKKRFGYRIERGEQIRIAVVAAPVKDPHGPFYSFAYVVSVHVE